MRARRVRRRPLRGAEGLRPLSSRAVRAPCSSVISCWTRMPHWAQKGGPQAEQLLQEGGTVRAAMAGDEGERRENEAERHLWAVKWVSVV